MRRDDLDDAISEAEVSRLRERIAELESENARLRAALRPFARMVSFFGDCDGPKKLALVGIFRYQADQARAALEGDAPKED